MPRPLDRAASRGLHLLVAMLVLATGGLGVAKLVLQRAHPPAYAVRGGSSYAGFVSIDGYAARAEHLRDALARRDGAFAQVRADVTDGYHPTSFLVPLAVAVLALTGLAVPLAFAALSLAATLATALCAGRIARLLAGDGGARAGPLAVALVLGHQLVVRGAAQLTMDPFCALICAAAVLLLFEWRERPRASVELALFALLSAGIGVKVSLLPLLGAPAAILLLDGGLRRPARLARSVLLFGLLPLVPWVAFLTAAGGLGNALVDFEHQGRQLNYAGWRYLGVFGAEMLLLFQAFPLALLLPRAPGSDRGRLRVVWVVLGLVLLATWSVRLLPVPREYLPVPALLAALAAPRIGAALARPGARRTRGLLGLHLAGNYALAIAALWLSLGG